jgi:hypothetical protein
MMFEIKDMNHQAIWELIENYANKKASHEVAEEVGYGKAAVDAEIEYKKARAEVRALCGLSPESES